ncbi:MAG: SDR family oxidoreductase [Cyanobacteriota bacterium]
MTSPIERRALITGASSGIGKATALAFAKAGFHVALVSRSESKLEAVAEAARKTGVTAKAYALDLADIEQVREKVSAIADSFGPIDVLVNNAGMGYTGEIMSTPLSEWQQVIDLNLTSVFQCIQGILPSMRDRGSGIIINVASIAGQQPFPGWGAYNVSKAALIALSKTLAAEERAKGIRVVTISPGAVNTPIWDTETVQADLNRSAMLTPEIVAQSILHMALVPEQATIEELTLMPNAGVL